MSLVQGNMTVTEYEKRFTELATYALTFMVDEGVKYKRFEESLHTKVIAPVITNMDWSDFSKLVEVAIGLRDAWLTIRKIKF